MGLEILDYPNANMPHPQRFSHGKFRACLSCIWDGVRVEVAQGSTSNKEKEGTNSNANIENIKQLYS